LELSLACSLVWLFAIYNLEGNTLQIHIIHGQPCLIVSAWATYFYCFSIWKRPVITAKRLLPDMLWLGNLFAGWGVLFPWRCTHLGGLGFTPEHPLSFPPRFRINCNLEPAFTAICIFLLNEILTETVNCGVLILMGVILLRFGDR